MGSIRFRGHFVFGLALACVPAFALPNNAPVFGSVVAIGGSASDIALDESRRLLYIANFGGNTIQVMSTATNTIQSSINVQPWPGAIALSPDGQYLVVAHYCNVPTTTQTSPACTDAVTSIHLPDYSQQVFSLTEPPLGVAFMGNGQALVVTTSNFMAFTPATGQLQLIGTIANVALALPVPLATFPGQILEASLTTSQDGSTIWGIASAGTSSQFIFQYKSASNAFSGVIETSSPLLLPRISSSSDGSYAMVDYTLIGTGAFGTGTQLYLKGRYPNIISATNISGSAIDQADNIIYAQLPDSNQSTGPAGSATPAMLIMDADNLTFRDRVSIPEDMVGRAVLNASATTMYAVSESGVMVLPVGSLNSYHRVTATQEDLFVATNFCNTAPLSQSLTITDPGGGHTDFAITSSQPGVTIVPATGTTPATVKVVVNSTAASASSGTTASFLTITSQSAVNHPKPVRLLVNNPDPSQRGTIIDQPGVLSDILPDQARNRVYVLRQDMNQLLIYNNGSTLSLLTTLRTATSPTMMAMTNDGNFLLVGHDDSQLIMVYDLNALQAVNPVLMPGGHYARSIAISGNAMLVLARNEGNDPTALIDSIDLSAGTATALPTLGVYQNIVSPTGVLATSPSGTNVLYASPDGNVALYTSSANTFVNSRKDLTALSGAFAAADSGMYVVGNSILNSSLVPNDVVSSSPLLSSGFTFNGQHGYAASTASASASGSMVQLSLPSSGALPTAVGPGPLITVEAPLLPTATTPSPAIDTAYGTYGSGSISTHSVNAFARTVAPLVSNGTLAVLSTSGLTVLATSYPAVATPTILGVTSAADGSPGVAPGGLISIYGQNMSGVTFTAGSTPLSTSVANSCTGVNGTPIPLLYVSASQINAQLPFNAGGNETLTIHTPAGISNSFPLAVQPTAPAVFMSGAAGPQTGLALVIRDDNYQLVTPTNPIHPKDIVTIYLTGMGQTTPAIQAGVTVPSSPLSQAAIQPTITLGGAAVSVGYAGLAPGEIGVYQINATVPAVVPTGLAIPLTITQDAGSTTLNVRVVD